MSRRRQRLLLGVLAVAATLAGDEEGAVTA